jgi:hypothetical protein
MMWKNMVAEQATGDNMAHAHCILDSWGYKHTLRMCNSYCFSTATVVARTRLNVTLPRALTVAHFLDRASLCIFWFFITPVHHDARPIKCEICQYTTSKTNIHVLI